jgi:amino acid transporter
MLYSISDLESIITSTGSVVRRLLCSSGVCRPGFASYANSSCAGPSFVPFEISQQGLRSDTAAAVILCAGIILGFFISNAVLQSASRVVWAFAKDHGFAYSHILSRIHPGLEIPVWATILTWFFFALVGCIIPASSIGKPCVPPG